jgi:hypothetical protein
MLHEYRKSLQKNNTSGKPQKNGYLYVHYQNWDALRQIIGFNANRILREKAPYPVLVASQSDKEKLFQLRESLLYGLPDLPTLAYIDFYGLKFSTLSIKFLNLPGFRTFNEVIKRILSLMGFDNVIKTGRQIHQALYTATKSMEVEVGLADLGADDKLYLLGHGAAGMDGVSDASDMHGYTTMEEYALQLKKANLSRAIRDIRATWCESGDHTPAASFAPEQTNDPIDAFNRKLTPAQMLSLQLTKLGYKNISVTGYKGLGSIYPDDYDSSKPRYFTSRTMMTTTSLGTREPSERIRSSTVRKTYMNGRRVEL